MVEKLATFRSDKDTWDSFIAKAKANGTNASALLQGFVQSYLDGEAIQPSRQPDIDNLDERIDNAVSNAIAPIIAKLEDDYQQAIIDAKHEMRMFVIQGVTGAIDKPYFGIEETSETSLNTEVQPVDNAIATIPTEAIALSKKAPVLAPNLKALALEKILQVA